MSHGQEESIASVQLDFNSADKFDLNFVASSGESMRPWIIHRAPLGSHERLVALLLEFYDGALPGWLCPVQLYILPINEDQYSFAKELADSLSDKGIRVVVDNNVGSLSKRILFAHKFRPLFKLVIGKSEMASEEFSMQGREGDRVVRRQEIEDFLLKRVAVPK